MRPSILFRYLLVTGLLFGLSGVYAQTGDRASGADIGQVIEEVITIGSFIRRKDQADQASPIQVVDSDHLDDIAAFNVVDLITTLSNNNGAQNQSDGFNQAFSIGTTNVNLRGLGLSSTLTLLNGRRQTLTAATTLNGDQFVDLNALVPGIAISQVEILEDGASALYGSDAVAGVVNFKTRNDFEGIELEAGYATTTSDSQDDLQLSALAGFQFGDNVHLLAAISYFDRNSLGAAQRRNEFQIRDAFSIFGNPGTYLVFGPTPGPPTRKVDPMCAALAASNDDVNLIAAGPIAPTCQFDFGDFFSLVAKEERLQLFTRADITAGEAIDLFLEFGYANNAVISTGSPSQPILFPQNVPSTNPAAAVLGIAPGGRALSFVRVDGAGQAPNQINLDYETFRFSGGLMGDFNSTWSWQAAVVYSKNSFDYLNASDTKKDRYIAALNGMGGASNNQFFNPLFGATNPNGVREDFRGILGNAAEATLLTLDGHVTGEFGNLPGGGIGFAAGFQHRKDELSYDYSDDANSNNLFFFGGNQDFSGSKDVSAVFAEADIPILDTLSIQLAVRHEDFGAANTTDPKVGFLWRPVNELSLRGTFSTAFRVASLFQDFGSFSVPARVADPMNDGDLVTVSRVTLSDPSNPVKTQSSDVWNLGVTWDSADIGFTVSLDYWSFDYSDFITPENATAIVAANASDGTFANQLVRNETTGDLLSVSTFFRNAGSLKTTGLDLTLGKSWNLGTDGSVTASINFTNVLSYDLVDPVSGQIDGLGQRNFTNFGVPMPKFRGSFGLLWTSGERHSANIFVRYTDDYKDENNMNAKIESFITLDAQYRLQIPGWGGVEEGPSISIGAKNLGDKMPPDVKSRTGYDALTHSPLGRQIYLSIRQRF